jgi:exosortase A-associated hydrolase 2
VSAGAQGEPCEPFFLPAERGERFCIYHPAAGQARGGIVYLHPFAEEMNKSRRMAALQSRMFAAHGYAVLQIDLFGCGDSSGDFGEANWEIWRQDAVLGMQWLRQRIAAGIALWGLRLGALLALDAARICDPAPDGFVLWQPVVSGEQILTQFLRLLVATGMIADGVAQTSTQDLRNKLKAGALLEIAGYGLGSELALAIDSLKLAALAPRNAPVLWLEVVPEAGRSLSPASRRVVDAWIASGVAVSMSAIAGEPFWNTIEIAECPALLAETMRMVAAEIR